MDPQVKYRESLSNILPAGCGNCTHTHFLRVANYGRKAGLSPEQVFEDLRRATPRGKRPVTEGEHWDAVKKAFSGSTGDFVPKPKPIIRDGALVLRRLIEQGQGATEESIRDASPVRIDGKDDAVLTLQTLYSGDALLFIGEREDAGILGKTIRPCSEWIEHFRGGGKTGPHLIVNSLTGEPAPLKSDPEKMTFRGDGNVISYRFAVVEFDNLSREDQLAFWSVAPLPVCALIDSGGKSLHGWIDVRRLADVRAAEEWNLHIRTRLYHQLLVPLGVDSACSNPSRLSRLPGHYRAEKGRVQRLLFLSPS
jgi:hypothetical protein